MNKVFENVHYSTSNSKFWLVVFSNDTVCLTLPILDVPSHVSAFAKMCSHTHLTDLDE